MPEQPTQPDGGAADRTRAAPRPQRGEPAPTADIPCDPPQREQATLVSAERAAVPIAPKLPQRIGQYQICRSIGRGGMGTVYEAMQEHPQRPVALKVMNAGLTSRSALRRFEYESQILGRLRHPGIAQIYEAGTHDDGSGGVPFFAMEFIPDAKILTQFAEQRRMDVRERLELFIKICDAVHHGHQKGVIHRDLKPHNILVDASGQPKIIDFGIARIADADLSASLQTRAGDLVGTVPYMSPEQCAGHANDIDTRSDVYALGVVLYELLTGQLPYDVESAHLLEATRIIRDAPPTPLRRLRSDLSGDVEAIVFKALEKERERRYQSAHELAVDIRRYLNDEPISARPPSLSYHLRTFARRNKALVTGAAVVVVVLLGGIVGTTTGMVKAQNASALAERRAQTSQRITEQFQEMFSTLDKREGGAGPEVRLSEVLDGFAADLDDKLADEPEVRAALQWSIGNGYKALTLYDHAEIELRKALGLRRQMLRAPDAELAQTIEDLASALFWKRRYEEAEGLYREALAMRRQLFGSGHEIVAHSINYLAASLDGQRRHADAEALYRESLQMREQLLGENHELVARSMNNLATCLMAQGRLEDAERYFRAAVSKVRQIRGDDHIDVAGGLTNLARCMIKMRRTEEAERHLREALTIRRNALGNDNAFVALTEHHLAEVLLELDRADEADSICRDALRIRRDKFEPADARVRETLALMGRILQRRAAWGDAEPVLRELVDMQRGLYPRGHVNVVAAEGALGECLVHLGRYDEAETVLEGGYEWLAEQPGSAGSGAAAVEAARDESLRRLVALYEAWSRPADAERYGRLLQARGK